MSAPGRGCVKTPNNGVFVGTKMPPRVAIVDSRASCEVDSSIELSKIEFSHSLDPERTSVGRIICLFLNYSNWIIYPTFGSCMNIRISKHFPALGKEQIDRLNKLAKLSLAVYGEQDVRENFLAPLIELLGYERGRDYDVLTEDMKDLFPFYVMLGSTKFKLDYRFVVWKQGFWL